ncbi:MAG TPA: hypothetical protein DEB17_06300 [Chlorobaculum sp.]|uniref:Uncharacterized protein n=1 Tax=Chlorobaculum tepidum (strain ATCC 49652 / DSM 12025 / NBRC 103806 / TLS) TaxID=194439 RepID=Q8KCX5_CHLTE|nr:hypothetical protein CT1282 [Chlorobaculum tepidum TLS]HBU23593.1 hypothetical protein [Chlorobaculum sp.]
MTKKKHAKVWRLEKKRLFQRQYRKSLKSINKKSSSSPSG